MPGTKTKRPGLLSPVGILVSNTVPSSRDPVYQQLTVSPFFGKFVLSPFFSTDLEYLGGPWEEGRRIQTMKQNCTSTVRPVPHPQLPFWLLWACLRFWQLSPARWLPQQDPSLWTSSEEKIKIKSDIWSLQKILLSKYNSYFTLKELIVGNDQLFFLCRFSHIFDVSQQLMLTEELREEHTRQTNINRRSAAFPPPPKNSSINQSIHRRYRPARQNRAGFSTCKYVDYVNGAYPCVIIPSCCVMFCSNFIWTNT